MQTRCPHCETQFRVTEEQCQIADGIVRCGVCNETFNALDESPDITTAEVDKISQPASPETTAEPAQDQPQSPSEPPGGTITADYAVTDDTSSDAQPSWMMDEKSRSADTTTTGDDFDLFQTTPETDTTASNTVVPQEFVQQRSTSLLGSILWSIAIVFLALTLILEYVWFNRNQFAQIPQAKPWIEQICKLVDCNQAALRDPSQIELLSRNIYSHPNHEGALIVAVTLVNHASHAQPYPLMQIDFSDVRGKVIAARRFTAETYLQTDQAQLRLLPPDLPTSFTMEIVDPGKQAMTYEFNFL